ncbi:MAG: hypothetical protein CMH56_16525 [Myxococcales bacterium]|nr:hypothetical protein [Myxococcales bacterium]|tara:strand:- start:966 stop:2915 length:1950 start_codon:yes stop_codon:yes gene_type:complete
MASQEKGQHDDLFNRSARLLADALWAFSPGALLGLGLWALVIGSDLNFVSLKNPKKLHAFAFSLNLAFFGGGLLHAIWFYLRLQKEEMPQRQMKIFGVWLTGWLLLFWKLDLFQNTLWRWIFFTLPLSWFAARVATSKLRSSVTRTASDGDTPFPKQAFTVLAGAAFGTYCLFSLTRHYSFGSGSWDMGCYNHNIWLIAHFKPLISTVLGEVNFMGDHFVPVLVLFAPLAYLGSTGALLVLQGAAVAMGVMPIFAIAKRRAMPPQVALAICVGYLFAVGTQSMINFDFHEIALVPSALLFAFWALEIQNKRVFLVAALLIFLSKESAIVYAGALGFYAFLFSPGMRRAGLLVFVICVPSFFLVVGFLQPTLLEGGPQGMIHLARFKAFGDTAPEALLNMVMTPGKAFFMLMAPAVKAKTWLVTLGTFAFLPLLAPELFVVMLPNLMERFLSNKQEMWGLSFHYSVVWVSLCTYAALVAATRLNNWASRLQKKFDLKDAQPIFQMTLGLWLFFCWVGTMLHGPKVPEFKTLQKSYFSKPAQIPINEKAIEMIPPDAKVVAQNHFLPFLAFRQHIWQPQNQFFAKADHVILNPTEGSWPHSKKHVKRWVRRLYKDPAWTLIFSEGTTVIFAKKATNSVTPSAQLRRAMPRL